MVLPGSCSNDVIESTMELAPKGSLLLLPPLPSSVMYWQTIRSRHWYWSKFFMDPNTLSIEPMMLGTGPSLGVKSADVPAVPAATEAEEDVLLLLLLLPDVDGLNMDDIA